MFQTFVASMLGPSGMLVLNWYAENSLYINGVIVLVAIIALLAPKRTKMLKEKIARLWAKTPFVLDEKDRRAVDLAHARLNSMKSKRR